MGSSKYVMIVDDNMVNRQILNKIISQEYKIIEAENGKAALELLKENGDIVGCIILDLVMPVMDGYQFLEEIKKSEEFSNTPIIVTTINNNNESEIKALKLGAWDFVTKPYNADIIKFRIKNAMARSQLAAFERLKYLAEYDTLTGIYNKNKFFSKTESMLRSHSDVKFVFIHFDIDRFQLINLFYGYSEGNNLLKYIANKVKAILKDFNFCTYGRIESDVFCFCHEYKSADIDLIAKKVKAALVQYNNEYDIIPNMGMYLIENNKMPIEKIFNNARLAAKKNKGNFIDFYSFYTDKLGEELVKEQEIVNDMKSALAEEQFVIYIQPKYDITTNKPCGGEVLVRWNHPKKGMILPGDFISIFERNGYITKLDYYVWEKSCKQIRKWLDEGEKPAPISVNVSRVNLYNPQIAEKIRDLVKKYDIPPELFNLEITESAYTDNPMSMKDIIAKLKGYGFTILMDDFGSGYSSLNILKDMDVDILKIDMKFLANSKVESKGKNILASVIRMSKWLKIPVICEGVETGEQVKFLRSVGCEYAQGFYFSKPIPVEDYETLMRDKKVIIEKKNSNSNLDFDFDTIFQSNLQMKMLFCNMLQTMVIYEFDGENIEILRVNDGFFDMFGPEDLAVKVGNPLEFVAEDYRKKIINTFKATGEEKEGTECEYIRKKLDGTNVWVRVKLKLLKRVDDKSIILGTLEDITSQKMVDLELDRYREAISGGEKNDNLMLIVDDEEENRTELKELFKDEYEIIEATNGYEALNLLDRHGDVGIILLDLIMPKMNGEEFLQKKRISKKIANIPVIAIAKDNSFEKQFQTLDFGINDYIMKPFVPEFVKRRVNNVLNSEKLMKAVIKKYDWVSRLAETDQMTGLYNRVTAEKLIKEKLSSEPDSKNAMIMIDVDNFKPVNDKHGHAYGDKVLTKIGQMLKESFRKDDYVIRMGGDEFAVFMLDVHRKETILNRCNNFRNKIIGFKMEDCGEISCSIGIALTPEHGSTFSSIYSNADIALYEAKSQGKNRCCFYNSSEFMKG